MFLALVPIATMLLCAFVVFEIQSLDRNLVPLEQYYLEVRSNYDSTLTKEELVEAFVTVHHFDYLAKKNTYSTATNFACLIGGISFFGLLLFGILIYENMGESKKMKNEDI